jgi:proteasome beta subunit
VTLVIAFRCSDGVLMASDSQATESTGGVRSSVQKIFPLTDRAIWGASGAVQPFREIRERLGTVPDLHQNLAGETLIPKVQPVMMRHLGATIQNVPGTELPTVNILACGYTADGCPWLLEITPNCTYDTFEEMGFHAIGSGASFAQVANAVFAQLRVTENPLEYGKMVAYRLMDTVIETSIYGIHHPIQLWTVDQSGSHKMQESELTELRDAVGTWRGLERDILTDLLSGRVPGGDSGGTSLPPATD